MKTLSFVSLPFTVFAQVRILRNCSSSNVVLADEPSGTPTEKIFSLQFLFVRRFVYSRNSQVLWNLLLRTHFAERSFVPKQDCSDHELIYPAEAFWYCTHHTVVRHRTDCTLYSRLPGNMQDQTIVTCWWVPVSWPTLARWTKLVTSSSGYNTGICRPVARYCAYHELMLPPAGGHGCNYGTIRVPRYA